MTRLNTIAELDFYFMKGTIAISICFSFFLTSACHVVFLKYSGGGLQIILCPDEIIISDVVGSCESPSSEESIIVNHPGPNKNSCCKILIQRKRKSTWSGSKETVVVTCRKKTIIEIFWFKVKVQRNE